MSDKIITLLDTIASLEKGSCKRSTLLNYCKTNNISERKMWRKIVEYDLGVNTKNNNFKKIMCVRNIYREQIINLLPGTEHMAKQDFLGLLEIEHLFLLRILTLLDQALYKIVAHPFRYYDPAHGEKVLNTLIDKLGRECEALFGEAFIIPIQVVKNRYRKKALSDNI